MKLSFLIILICLILGQPTTHAQPTQPASLDIVFDLDWTLFYPVDRAIDAHTVVLPEGHFHLADGVIETLIELHRQGHRVSLFSGGQKPRNQALADWLLKEIQAKGVLNFSFYKVLNFEDLSLRSGAKPDARFAEKWQKNLQQINPDLNRVVLVDDNIPFNVAGQEKNFYWLEKTYKFYAEFNPQAVGTYDPPNKMAWQAERNKIPLFLRNLTQAQKYFPGSELLPSLQDLREGKSLCPRVF